MPAVLVDSNVILDIVTQDPEWLSWSEQALESAAEDAPLVVNPLIFAEISVSFQRIEDLDRVLPRAVFRRDPLPYEAGFLAGKAFLEYRKRGGSRRSPLPDFYIGAHAAVARLQLLPRDAARYRTNFPSVDLIAPS